jgi:hypothetical protein
MTAFGQPLRREPIEERGNKMKRDIQTFAKAGGIP